MDNTRREFLKQAATLTGVAVLPSFAGAASATVRFRLERDRLGAESSTGFQFLLQQCRTLLKSSIVIAPAACTLTLNEAFALRDEMQNGALLILESGLSFARQHVSDAQLEVLSTAFGIAGVPLAPSHRDLQIRYVAPIAGLTRRFGHPTSIGCASEEVIAWCCARPVAFVRSYGTGRLVYLGAMLGPNLYAEEREAMQLGAALLNLS